MHDQLLPGLTPAATSPLATHSSIHHPRQLHEHRGHNHEYLYQAPTEARDARIAPAVPSEDVAKQSAITHTTHSFTDPGMNPQHALTGLKIGTESAESAVHWRCVNPDRPNVRGSKRRWVGEQKRRQEILVHPRACHGQKAVTVGACMVVFGGGNEELGMVDELRVYDTGISPTNKKKIIICYKYVCAIVFTSVCEFFECVCRYMRAWSSVL